MKKFLSVALALIILFSFVACNKNEPDIEENQNETNSTEWQEAYQSTLYEFLDESVISSPVEFASAYISDTNADGIPTVALSLNGYTYEYPDIILNYVDGEVVELPLGIDDYGFSVSESIYFVNGTNDIVFRSYGNTTGTFGANEFQKIYSITETGKYEVVSDKEFVLSEEMLKEYTDMLANGGNDLTDYQQAIFSQMDEEIEMVTGVASSLVDYKSVSVSFLTSLDDAEVDMERALQYINQMLEINLTEDGSGSKTEINNEQKGVFNAEKYVGDWVNVNGDGHIELFVSESKGNKLTCEFVYVRLWGFGPAVVEVNDDGTAKFKMRVGPWTYAGQLIFMDDQIKLILDEATAPYSEIKCETIVFERVDYEENDSSTIKNDEETTASAKAEAVTSSQEKESTTKKQTISSCTHKISSTEVIGEQYIGVKNRITVEPDCVREGYEIYRCPDCMEMAIYKTIEPLGHDFSDKEELCKYPSAKEDGAYGKRCQGREQSGQICQEYVKTRTIPKRGGSYSSIDSRFEIYCSGMGDAHVHLISNQESYTMENPRIRIIDERTWGDVPTIKYNSADKSVYIAYHNQNNELIEVTEKYNEEYASQGYTDLRITLLDNGQADIRYGGLFG